MDSEIEAIMKYDRPVLRVPNSSQGGRKFLVSKRVAMARIL